MAPVEFSISVLLAKEAARLPFPPRQQLIMCSRRRSIFHEMGMRLTTSNGSFGPSVVEDGGRFGLGGPTIDT